jgi:hypothetical protein
VSECDREASKMRRSWPTRGCCAVWGGGAVRSHVRFSVFELPALVSHCFSDITVGSHSDAVANCVLLKTQNLVSADVIHTSSYSSVAIVTRLPSRPLSKALLPAMGTTWHPIQLGTGSQCPALKQPQREPDHLAPYSAEVTNEWSCMLE